MWNPIDGIGDFIDDTVDAVKQVIRSGGVKNATRDVANRAATQGAGGGYAAPARAAASEAALRAYEKQSKTYKDIALLADAVLTGGVSDPIARAGAARVSGDSAAQQKALIDLLVASGLALGGQKLGEVVEAPVERGLSALIGKLNQIIAPTVGRFEYGISPIAVGDMDVIKPLTKPIMPNGDIWYVGGPNASLPGSFTFRTVNDAPNPAGRAAWETGEYFKLLNKYLQIKNKDPRIQMLIPDVKEGVAITKIPKGTFFESLSPMGGRTETGARTSADQQILARIFPKTMDNGVGQLSFINNPTFRDIYPLLEAIRQSVPASIQPAVGSAAPITSKLAQLAMFQERNNR
jgi:hypothetical protein